MRIKRILAILLAALLLLPLGFAVRGTAETTEDVWSMIDAYEDAALSGKKSPKTTAADYAKLVDDIEKTVLSWDGYAEGSLVRNGSALYWDGTDGMGYGYLPALRAKLHNAKRAAEPMAGSETFSYGVRGGQPTAANVAVFQPYYGIDTSFTTQYADEGTSIAETTGGTCTVYRKADATIDAIADALESSAVVFFDSHGVTDDNNSYTGTETPNTSYLCLQSGTGLTSEDKQTVQGPNGYYKHAFYGGSSYENGQYMYIYCVDGTAIANHMEKPAANNFLWMAICLGMATDGLAKPLRDAGTEVVYGYTQSVTFDGDYEWEEAFWNKMKQGKTVAEAAAYMKQQVGYKDPYERLHPAYPIFVSDEDVILPIY